MVVGRHLQVGEEVVVGSGDLRPDPGLIKVLNNVTIAGGATAYTSAISLKRYRPGGYGSLQVHAIGAGAVTISPEGSNNYGDPSSTDSTGDFLKPSSASNVVAGHTATSGPSGDGKEIYDSKFWGMPVTNQLRFKIVNTSGSSITLNAWYCLI